MRQWDGPTVISPRRPGFSGSPIRPSASGCRGGKTDNRFDSLNRNLFSALHPEAPQFRLLKSQPRLQHPDSPENRPSSNYLFDQEIFEDPVWHAGCITSHAMVVEQRIPKKPDTRYSILQIKQVIRCIWNKVVVLLAIQVIIILYALLRFLLNKNRVE